MRRRTLALGVILVVVMGIKYWGGFQWGELALYDLYWRLTPWESPDPKIVIVEIGEEDIRAFDHYPPTDEQLAQLISLIDAQHPKAIALDLFRDLSISKPLAKVFRQSETLIGIGIHNSVRFPTILQQKGQAADVSLYADEDEVIRRLPLYPLTDGSVESGLIPNLGFKLAYWYLKGEKNFQELKSKEKFTQLNNYVFVPLQPNDGGFSRLPHSGYQMLIRWRKSPNPFKKITAQEVLQGQIVKEEFTNKVILIGYSDALSVKDRFLTPIGWLYGVEIQAHATSQILNAVTEGRGFFRFLPESIEYLLLIGVVVLAYYLWQQLTFKQVFREAILVLGLSSLSLVGLAIIGFFAFLNGWWFPVFQLIITYIFLLFGFTFLGYLSYIHHLNNSLEQQIADKTKNLEETLNELRLTQQKRTLEAKQASLGFLTERLAHEIRNPLDAIRFANLYLNQVLEKNSEDLHQWLNNRENLAKLRNKTLTIEEILNRIFQLIDNIRASFQGEGAKFQNLDVVSVITQVLQQFRDLLESPNIRLITDLTPVAPIFFSKIILEEIILNLLINAQEAILAKGIEPGVIKITLRQEANQLVLTTEDNGIGIREDNLDKIFDIYWSTKAEGRGIGLFFVYQQLKNFQGSIQVDSQVERGTIFTIYLPIRP